MDMVYGGRSFFWAFTFIFSTSPYDLALNQTQIRQFCHNQFNDKESIFEQWNTHFHLRNTEETENIVVSTY